MNDTNIEHLLRALKPAAPSAELTERVQRDLALAELFRETEPVKAVPPQRPRTWTTAVLWAGLGAAAAVLVMSALPVHPTARPPQHELASTASSTSILPVNSTREWVDVEDEGITFTSPDNPERRVRVRSLERRQWIDPRDGAEYTVEVPQVESVTLPVKFQ